MAATKSKTARKASSPSIKSVKARSTKSTKAVLLKSIEATSPKSAKVAAPFKMPRTKRGESVAKSTTATTKAPARASYTSKKAKVTKTVTKAVNAKKSKAKLKIESNETEDELDLSTSVTTSASAPAASIVASVAPDAPIAPDAQTTPDTPTTPDAPVTPAPDALITPDAPVTTPRLPVRALVPLPVNHDHILRTHSSLAAVVDLTAAEFGFDVTLAERTEMQTQGTFHQVYRAQAQYQTPANMKAKKLKLSATKKAYLIWLADEVVFQKRRHVGGLDMKAICEAYNRKFHFEIEDGSGNYLGKGYNDLDSAFRRKEHKRVAYEDRLVGAAAPLAFAK